MELPHDGGAMMLCLTKYTFKDVPEELEDAKAGVQMPHDGGEGDGKPDKELVLL